jgi:hypothetical protein
MDYRFAIFARVFDMQKQSCGRKYVSDDTREVSLKLSCFRRNDMIDLSFQHLCLCQRHALTTIQAKIYQRHALINADWNICQSGNPESLTPLYFFHPNRRIVVNHRAADRVG